MKRFSKFLVPAAALVVFSAIASATPTCGASDFTTYVAGYACTTTFSSGAFAGDSILFTINTATGFDATAANVAVGIDANTATGLAGFLVSDKNGSFTGTGTFGYTATLAACASGFTCAFTGYTDQVFITSGTGTFSDTANPAGPSGSPFILNISNQTALQLGTVSASSVSKSTSLATFNGSMLNTDTDVAIGQTPNSGVPEPTTFVLMGAGLGLIGMMRRRNTSRR